MSSFSIMGRRKCTVAKSSASYYSKNLKRAKVVHATVMSQNATIDTGNANDEDAQNWEDIPESVSINDDFEPQPAEGNSKKPPSRFKLFCDEENAAWSSLCDSGALLSGLASYFNRHACVICGVSSDTIYRCTACHLLSVCPNCLELQHAHMPPHVVQRWNGKFFEDVKMNVQLTRLCGCTSLLDGIFPVTVITSDASELSVDLHVCSCTTYHSALLSHGFWPLQTRPECSRKLTAISVDLLLLLDSLNCNCTASLSSLCAALKRCRESVWASKTSSIDIFRALNSTGAFRSFRRVLQSIRWGENASCPACHVDETSATGDEPLFLMMDGCFGLRHRKNAGNAALPAPSGFFLEVDLTEKFPPSEGHCANWSAGGRGRGLTTVSDCTKLDVFGAFSGSCRHSAIKYLADMTSPGERLNYATTMITQMLRDVPQFVRIVVSYDIACKLIGRFADPRLSFAIPAFHSYGHVLRCQLSHGIRSVNLVGLTDGESVERVWATFRRFGPQLKEMAHDNRREFFNYLANTVNFQCIMKITSWLSSRKSVERKAIEKFNAEFSAFLRRNKSSMSLEDFLRAAAVWKQEVLATLSANSKSASPKSRAVQKLYRLACERRYLIEHAGTERGQRMQKLLRHSLNKLLSKARKICSTFNNAYPTEHLEPSDFMNPEAPCFDQIVSCKLQVQKVHAIKLRDTYLRIQEESRLVYAEAERALVFFIAAARKAHHEVEAARGDPIAAVLSMRESGVLSLLEAHYAAFGSEFQSAHGPQSSHCSHESDSPSSPSQSSGTVFESASEIELSEETESEFDSEF